MNFIFWHTVKMHEMGMQCVWGMCSSLVISMIILDS